MARYRGRRGNIGLQMPKAGEGTLSGGVGGDGRLVGVTGGRGRKEL